MVVSEATLGRSDLSSFYDVLQWSDDGTLAVTANGQLIFLKPKHAKPDVKINNRDVTNSLFEVERIDLETLPRNDLYLSEVSDEVGSPLFSGVDVLIVKSKWSPLTSSNESFLGALTNRGSLLLFKQGELWKDLTSNIIAETQLELDQNIVQSFDWSLNGSGTLSLIVGLASGDIKHYNYIENSFREGELINLSPNSIVLLKSFGDTHLAITSVNELYIISKNITQLKGADRFKIHDIYLYEETNSVLFTSSRGLTKISITNKSTSTISLGLLSTSKILPTSHYEVTIFTENRTIKVDLKSFTQCDDNTVDPVLQSRLKRWNANFNDYNTKIYKLKLFGYDLNYQGNIIAVLYDIHNVNGLRYKISSETTLKIAFIPISTNQLQNKPSPLAIFQNYKLSETLPDLDTPLPNDLDFSSELQDFLSHISNNNTSFRTASIKNLIESNQDGHIRKLFAHAITKYVSTNNFPITDDTDKIVYNTYLRILGKPEKEGIPSTLSLTTGPFTQTFDFNSNTDLEIINSSDNIAWTRCSLTYLPILSPKVLVDSVTGKRIIDIERDTENTYGPLTTAILNLNRVSLFSGSSFVKKE